MYFQRKHLNNEQFKHLRQNYESASQQNVNESLHARDDAYKYGLPNMSNDCYRNAVFQALFSLNDMNQMALDILSSPLSKIITASRFSVTYYFFKMIQHNNQPNSIIGSKKSIIEKYLISLWYVLWDTEQNHRMALTNIGFSQNSQQDAHEFLMLFLEFLNRDTRHLYSVEANSRELENDPLKNKFTLGLNSEHICLNGDHVINVSDDFSCGLIIPLEEKIMEVSLNDCIYDLFEKRIINDYHCSTCNSIVRVKEKLTITSLPEILVLNLNRYGANSERIETFVSIPESLNLGQYSDNASYQQYELRSIICHQGPDTKSGHFISKICFVLTIL